MTSIKSNQPVVVVTHWRDKPMLELLAQSLTLYLNLEHPLYVITNDFNIVSDKQYKELLTPLLNGRELIIINQSEFGYVRSSHPEAGRFRYRQEGWVNQQVLKLAIAQLLPHTVREYLVLDCQNFLVNLFEWPNTDKTPVRAGPWSMHNEIWDKLCEDFSNQAPHPNQSLSTPIFLNRQIVCDMFESHDGLLSWSDWFVNCGHLVSEFATYNFWANVNGRWDSDHIEVPDWAVAYLRDGEEFNLYFKEFMSWFRTPNVNQRAWASINHRAWQCLTDKQYASVQRLLKKHGLDANLTEFRTQSSQ